MADDPAKKGRPTRKNPSPQEDEVSEYPTVPMTLPGTSNQRESSAMDINNSEVLTSTGHQEITEEPLLNVIPNQTENRTEMPVLHPRIDAQNQLVTGPSVPLPPEIAAWLPHLVQLIVAQMAAPATTEVAQRPTTPRAATPMTPTRMDSHTSVSGSSMTERETISVNDLVRAMGKGKQDHLPEYDGVSDVDDCIMRYESVAIAEHLDDTQKARRPFPRLKWIASTWYLMDSQRKSQLSWSQLVEDLRKTFRPEDYRPHLIRGLAQCVQGKEEPIRVYWMEKLSLCNRVNPNMDEEEEKRTHIKAGLLPRYRNRISGFLPCPIDMWSKLINFEADDVLAKEEREKEAATKAAKAEQPKKEECKDKKKEGSTPAPAGQQANTSSTKTDQSGTSSQMTPSTTDFRCYNCDKIGNMAGNCQLPDRRKKQEDTPTESKN